MRALPPARNGQSSVERLRAMMGEIDGRDGVTCNPVAAYIVKACVLGKPIEAERIHDIVSRSYAEGANSQSYVLAGYRAKLVAYRGHLDGDIRLPLGITLGDTGLKISRRKIPESQIRLMLEASESERPIGDFIQTGIPELDTIPMQRSLASRQRPDYVIIHLGGYSKRIIIE